MEQTPPFKVKMLNTTNTTYQYKIGQSGIGRFAMTMFWMDDFHTSYIKKVKSSNNDLYITTRNSEYTFKVLEPQEIPDFELDADTEEEYEQMIGRFIYLTN